MNTSPPRPGDDWMKIVTEKNLQTFAFAFTTDVRLDLSVANAPIIGSANLRHYFDASRAMFEQIAFSYETTVGARTFLEWEGEYKGRYIAGTTILVRNASGAIESVQLYHRPYDQVVAFAAELARRLELASIEGRSDSVHYTEGDNL